MRIALICNDLLTVPPIRGGAIQIYVDALASKLTGRHKPTVFAIADPDLPAQELSNGVEYLRIPKAEYVRGIAQVLSSKTFDIVVIFNRPEWLPRLKQSSPGSKFILSLHNERLRPSMISRRLGSQAVSLSDAIVTVSDYIRQSSMQRFPAMAGKSRTLYSGVDLGRFSPWWLPANQRHRLFIRRQHGLGKDAKVFLFAGRLSPLKGLHVLLQAMPYVVRKHPSASLLVVGSRWFHDNRTNAYVRRLYQLAKPLKTNVHFTQFIAPEVIHRYYQASDILVCPSQWQEPLARVLYEGMAVGLPIITTARGGNIERVTDRVNGWVVKSYTRPSAIASAMNALLDDSALAVRMGRIGRKMAEKEHGWDHVAQRWLNVIDQVVSAPDAAVVRQ